MTVLQHQPEYLRATEKSRVANVEFGPIAVKKGADCGLVAVGATEAGMPA